MGLLGNYSSLNSNVGKSIGSFSNNYERLKVSRMMAFYTGDAVISDITDKSSFQNGYTPPYTWHLAPKAGGMSMQINASGSIVFSLTPQYPTSVNMTGTSSFSAEASLVIGMLCAMLGGGDLTASISGIAGASATMVGTGDLEADITAFANMMTSLIGEGDLSADIGGIGNMTVDITVTGTGLTIENVGTAVWNALASLNNNPGTMGELLNNTGGGASPTLIADAVWDELKSGHTTPESYGKLVADIETIVKFIKTLELNQL